MYAIVDIETTGGSAQKHRITEIAIYLYDGQKIIDELVSLINPESYIPPHITQLTGITNEMVVKAPRFFEVAKRIVEITENASFVAHNVQFDYRFVQAEFKRLGYSFSRNTLCTVKLSRKYIPGYSSYSLGNICANLGIAINGRHRAAGDALATVKLFEKVLALNPSIKHKQIDVPDNIPTNLNKDVLVSIPEETGVYYFYNQQGNIIYIGKSINIRKRILEHFSRQTTKRALEMVAEISDIGYDLTGSELIALITEADAIKEHLPKYNKRSRRRSSQFGLYRSIDNHGYINLNIKKVAPSNAQPLTCFFNYDEAQAMLYKMVEKQSLCQKLCGLYDSASACFHYQIGQCKGACIGKELASSYNARVNKAIDSVSLGNNNLLLIDKGRNSDEQSFVKVVNGKIEGYGYFNPEYVGKSIDLLNETITPCGNHREAIFAVQSFISKRKVKVLPI